MDCQWRRSSVVVAW